MQESFKPVESKKQAKSFNLHFNEQAHQIMVIGGFGGFLDIGFR
jgi:hypothetical protein